MRISYFRWFLLLFGFTPITFLSLSGQADILETLSSGTYYLVKKEKCQSYDEVEAAQAIDKSRECLGTPDAMGNIKSFGMQFQMATAEQGFFSLLANQQAKELQCASDFSEVIANKNPVAEADILEKLNSIRTLKKILGEATTSLATDTKISEKVCPLSIDDLETESAPEPAFRNLCDKIIRARVAIQVLVNSIPVAQAPAVRKMIETYTSQKSDPENGKEMIHVAYRQAQTDLRAIAQKLRFDAIKGNLDRTTRRALIADPLLVERIKDSADSPAMTGFLCKMDSEYGKGADYLDQGAFMSSFVFTLGAGVALKLTGAGAKIFQGASAARAGGLVSLTATRILQVGALGSTGIASYSEIDKACYSGALPSYVSKKKAGEQCLSAPDLKELPRDNCVLNSTLSALGFAGVFKFADGGKVVDLAKQTWGAPFVAVDKFVQKSTPGKKIFAKYLEKNRQKDIALVSKINRPGIDASQLKAEMEPIWNSTAFSQKEQVDKTFEKYLELRKKNLSEGQIELAEEALKNKKTLKNSATAYYNPYMGEIGIGDAFLAEDISQYHILAHELEHLTQYGVGFPGTVIKRKWATLMKKNADAFSQPSRLQAEFEAMASQWDFLQAIPPEFRKQAAAKISASTKLNPHTKEMLLKDLELSFKKREEYILEVAPNHGYTHVNESMASRLTWGSLLLGAMGFIAAGPPP
jgi:hypothetical protein